MAQTLLVIAKEEGGADGEGQEERAEGRVAERLLVHRGLLPAFTLP
jgi:hypothetical protein